MRFAVLPFAIALALPLCAVNVWASTSHGAASGDDSDSPESEGLPGEASSSIRSRKQDRKISGKVSGKSRSSKSSRRSRRSRGPKPIGWAVPDTKLRTEPLPAPSGNLHVYVLATGETVKVNIYNEDGSYNIDALKSVSHMLRCKRTDVEKEVDPRLMTILSHVYDHYGKRIEIVSGFRNQRRTTSFHYLASASDIRIEGVEPKQLRNFVETLDAGGMGVGLYPKSKFVHVDVRPLPSFRWIDYSKSDPDSPDKRPPRGFKKKRKLQS